jgi:hypothetical protein
MRKKLIIKLGILGLAAIFLLSMASYSTDQEVTTRGKPDKPFKPGKPGKERIAFLGPDLLGDQVLEGCCPNAGPFPEYTMTLGFDVGGFTAGTTIDGYLFINGYGAGRNHAYKVQFWNDDLEIFIEIIGGDIDNDKKNKILTVTFENEECFEYWTETTTLVSFTLVRHESD